MPNKRDSKLELGSEIVRSAISLPQSQLDSLVGLNDRYNLSEERTKLFFCSSSFRPFKNERTFGCTEASVKHVVKSV